MECPSLGNKECDDCFVIARSGYEDGLLRRDPTLSPQAARALAENAGLQIQLEQPGVEAKSCAQRQHRAQLIGKTAAFGESYRLDDDDE